MPHRSGSSELLGRVLGCGTHSGLPHRSRGSELLGRVPGCGTHSIRWSESPDKLTLGYNFGQWCHFSIEDKFEDKH